jgi:hypothetical protein
MIFFFFENPAIYIEGTEMEVKSPIAISALPPLSPFSHLEVISLSLPLNSKLSFFLSF